MNKLQTRTVLTDYFENRNKNWPSKQSLDEIESVYGENTIIRASANLEISKENLPEWLEISYILYKQTSSDKNRWLEGKAIAKAAVKEICGSAYQKVAEDCPLNTISLQDSINDLSSGDAILEIEEVMNNNSSSNKVVPVQKPKILIQNTDSIAKSTSITPQANQELMPIYENRSSEQQSKLMNSTVQNYLDSLFPGWVMAEVNQKDIEECNMKSLKRSPSELQGDFDGDGEFDYAIRISTNNNLILLVFLSSGAVEILNKHPVSWWTVPLSLEKKGQKYGDYNTGESGTYPTDAITEEYCGKGAHTYLYVPGFHTKKTSLSIPAHFKSLITSD